MDILPSLLQKLLSPEMLPKVLFVVGLLIVAKVLKAVTKRRPKRRSRAKASSAAPKGAIVTPKAEAYADSAATRLEDTDSPATQLDRVLRVDFENIALLNKEEFRVLPILEAAVRQFGNGHRVMAQISMGQIIRPKTGSGTSQENWSALQAVNSKRFDFGIFDRRGYLAVALEYHGSGHYGERSAMSDAVKREALRSANVPLIELPETFRAEELTERLKPLLGAMARAG